MNQIKVDKIIRSKRRTISLEIDSSANLIVRAPIRVSIDYIDKIVLAKKMWIFKKQEYMRRVVENAHVIRENVDKNSSYSIIKERLDYYSSLLGIRYNKFKLTNPKKRWGSCNTKGNICINWKLGSAPQDIIDYVIVHELSHIIEHNHSKGFWVNVERVLPDYKKRKNWLKRYFVL